MDGELEEEQGETEGEQMGGELEEEQGRADGRWTGRNLQEPLYMYFACSQS